MIPPLRASDPRTAAGSLPLVIAERGGSLGLRLRPPGERALRGLGDRRASLGRGEPVPPGSPPFDVGQDDGDGCDHAGGVPPAATSSEERGDAVDQSIDVRTVAHRPLEVDEAVEHRRCAGMPPHRAPGECDLDVDRPARGLERRAVARQLVQRARHLERDAGREAACGEVIARDLPAQGQPGQQERQIFEPLRQGDARHPRTAHDRGIGAKPDPGAAGLRRRCGGERLERLAVRVDRPGFDAFANGRQLEAFAERIDDEQPEPTGTEMNVRAVAVDRGTMRAPRQQHIDRRQAVPAVHRHAGTVVRDRDHPAGRDGDLDPRAPPGEVLIAGVRDELEDHVQHPVTAIGIADIHPWPLASGRNLGVRITQSHGVDRSIDLSATRCADTGLSLRQQIKPVRESPELARHQPRLVDPERPDATAVRVRTPAGAELDVADPALAAGLGAGVRVMKLDRGAFDTLPLSLISRQTLAGLGALVGRELDVQRFRPNLLIDGAGGVAYPEDGWVGATLRIGALRMRVDKRDQRCVMVNLDPVTGAQDPAILRTIGRARQSCLGVYGSVATPGAIAVGDPVMLGV